MALRILQFGVVFAIGYHLGPASAGAADAPPSLRLTDPEDATLVRGESTTLRCDAKTSSASRVRIVWLHNDRQVEDDARRHVDDDGRLVFPARAKRRDVAGEYRCKASIGGVAALSGPAKIRVAAFGDFERQTINLSVPESQPAVLFCNIHSVPSADIRWELNSEPLPHDTRYVPLPNGALLITKTHSSDAGSYRCIATNSLLKKTKYSKIVQLRVSPATSEPSAPKFLPLDILPNATVLIGETVNLYCAVTGWPIPTVQWLNNNNVVINNSTFLRIENATLQDTGNYTCLAYNSGGRIFTKYNIEVRQKPYFNVTPASKMYPPAKTVRLDCQAKGVPTPKIYWLKNGEPLSNEARIKRHPTGLVISHTFTSDAGIYQCVAINSAGRIWSSAQLVSTVSDTPSPPQNVTCSSYDETSICLTWQSPSNVSVTAYSIYSYYTDGGREIAGPEFITNNTQHLATDLSDSTNYTFYLRLYSRVASEQSQKVTCETGVWGSRNLQVIPVNDTVVELSWSKISTDVPCDGTKLLFKVQWKRKRLRIANTSYTENTSFVVAGLLQDIEYDFRVSPASAHSDATPWFSFTPETLSRRNFTNFTEVMVPLAPEKLEASEVTATNVNLTWADANENTRFYTICVSRDEDCGDELKSASTSLEVTNLQPNTTYKFKVRSHSYDNYFGPFSEAIVLRTLADVPSKVLTLSYTPLNSTAACLHWKPPLRKNGKLAGYLILYTPNVDWPLDAWLNRSTSTDGDACTTDRVSAVLGNLMPDQEYTVYVRAASDVGLGNPSYPIKVTVGDGRDDHAVGDGSDGEVEYNQRLAIVMGISLSFACVAFCMTCILARKRCLKLRFVRSRMPPSTDYHPAVAHYASQDSSVQIRLEHPCSAEVHETEHLVGEEYGNHVSAPTHIDTKGTRGFPNGSINGSTKPYLNGHITNGLIHITENPRYHACNGNVKAAYEEDPNSNVRSSKFHDLQRACTSLDHRRVSPVLGPNG